MRTKEHSPLVKQMLASPTLNKQREYELAIRMRKGDKLARKLLIEGNVCYAVRFALCSTKYGVPLDELISEALTGMTRATEKYDPDRCNRFVTYAAHWMRAYMTMYTLRNWRLVNPTKGEKQAKMFFRLRKQMSLCLTQTGDFGTSIDIVSAYFKVDRDRAKRMLHTLTCVEASLDAPTGRSDEGGEQTLYDVLPSSEPSPEHTVTREREKADARAKVREMMALLTPRERKIIKLRYLCDPEDALSLDQIGKMFGVSRERIRQNQMILFAKLQRHLNGEPLEDECPPSRRKPRIKPLYPRARNRGRSASSMARVA